jgi:16S rRNA (cytosine967-C5)-methyltransferase
LLSHCLANFSDLKEDNLHLPLKEKFRITKEIAPEFKSNEIFPFDSLLSEKVDGIKFAQRFLHRPRLWIRIRKKFLDEVKAELAEKAIPYLQDTESPLSLSFSSSKSLTNLKSFEFGYFEIQDWASQQTLKYIPFKENDYWWDACAGSGGKSLMLADAEPSVQVLATDTRDSILENFGERFRKTGFTNYKSAVLDLTKDISVHDIPTENLSGIIADVPCSGSGTWSHTPERLLMFSENELERYRELQRKIIQNLVQFLKPGMPLVYITCSVFKKENEDNLDYFTSTFPLEVIKSGYIDGVSHDADTLFAAQMVAK